MRAIKMPAFIADGLIEVCGEYNVKKLKALNGKYELTVNSFNVRTSPMNRYLHGVLIPEFKNAMYEAGYEEINDNEIAKDLIKIMFLKDNIVNKNTGEVIERVRNTSELTKEEMTDLFDRVIRFCADKLSYVIPYPSENLLLNF